MLQADKAALRQEIRLHVQKTADIVKTKSPQVRSRLITIDAFRYAWQSERLMGFVSMPSEVDTLPLFAERSMIVPYCEANEIVPLRILSLDELELSSMKILEPKLSVQQDVSRQILPVQIDVVLVPGLAFDRFGNRLGRGRGYYDRFLCHLPINILTIGLTFDWMIRDQIPCGPHDCPVQMVVTESRILSANYRVPFQ